MDNLFTNYRLRKPDFVKIDIEGSEIYAVAGMLELIKEYKPVLLIEIHGRKAAEQTFMQFKDLNYRFQDIASAKNFSNYEELLNWFPDQVLQILCYPKT